MDDCNRFGDFITAKRRKLEITSLQMAEKVGVSPGYYCDMEKNRKVPPNRETLDNLISTLRLTSEEAETLYDLAGEARREVSLDLPNYIMGNEVVRVALRVAKEKAGPGDWERFINDLERK